MQKVLCLTLMKVISLYGKVPLMLMRYLPRCAADTMGRRQLEASGIGLHKCEMLHRVNTVFIIMSWLTGTSCNNMRHY